MSAIFIDVASVVYDAIAEPFITAINPASVNVGDDLFLLTLNGTCSVPGWGLIAGGTFKDDALVDAGFAAIYHKKADGTEGGTTVQVDTAGIGTGFLGRIYQFRGTNIEVEDTSENLDGNGNPTMEWDALDVNGGDRTLIAFVAQATSSSIGTPGGYTAVPSGESTIDDGPIALAIDASYLLNQSSAPAVTVGSGMSNGWITMHVALFTPSGRSFIVN